MERRIKGVLSPKASGSITITENGNYDVVDVANAVVEVPQPTGEIEITENGEHNVKEYETAKVNVKSSVMKKLLDGRKRAYYLFESYSGTSVDDIIQYDDTENVTYMYYMFNGCQNLTTIPLLNTSKVTNMAYMFSSCQKLTTIPLLDTSNVTRMENMFSSCQKLTTIPQLNTSNVTNMENMFYSCKSLLTIPQLDTSKVTIMGSMFYSCYLLEKIDLTYYNISSTSNSYTLFAGCYSLKAIIIRSFGTNYVMNSNAVNNCYHFLGTKHSQYNPNGDKDGYFYVPRAMVDTLKSATNWSTYATQIRALEDYTKDGTTTGELDLAKMGLV